MDKPRIFLGSSGKQEKLLLALTRGLEDVAHVEPWTTSFNPGTTTLERLLELTHEVDFAAFVFARDDWTTISPPASDPTGSGQASPRDNVVFEAGLFGGALGMRRTFILHASGAKLPSDLLGLTCVRYGETTTTTEMRADTSANRTGVYLALLQLVFTLGWTTYVIYLPKLAASVGIAPGTFIEGFAVIQPSLELDVVGVYTAEAGNGVSALHMERVPLRLTAP